MIPLRDDNPTSITPFVTYVFIAACVLVFLWQMSLGEKGFEAAVLALGVIPAALLGDARLPPELYLVPPVATVFSSMFLHGGFMHLAGNMLYLWIFGNNVEDSMGHTRFVIFYPAVRRGGGAGAGMAKPGLHHPHDRRQRRYFRRIGRLFTAVPARARAGIDSARCVLAAGAVAGHGRARLLVRAATHQLGTHRRRDKAALPSVRTSAVLSLA